MEKYIIEKLNDLYGKDLEKIDPILIKNIFDGRVPTIENKKNNLK